MKNIIINLFTILILSFFSSCNYVIDDVVGVYVSRNNLNTIDTVRLQNNGIYINCVYRKNDNTLIYKNVNKWHTKNNYILFEKFFTDEDEIPNKDFTAFEEVLITTMLPIEKKEGKIILHQSPGTDAIYLEKIE